MDDGSSNAFGREISFRGALEKCACSHDEPSGVHLMPELKIGWEGGSYSPQHGRKHPQEGGVQRLCLCFEGGAGTIGTVEASVRNGTPALVVQDTGRAADLIADYLLVYSGESSAKVRPRSSVKVVERRMHNRKKLIAEFAKLMLQDEIDRKNQGELRSLRDAIIMKGGELNQQYDIRADKAPEVLLALMDKLHAIATSGLCLTYRPGSVKKVGDKWVSVGIRESMSRCLLLGITKTVAPATFDAQLADARAMRIQRYEQSLPSTELDTRAQVSPPAAKGKYPWMQAAVTRAQALMTSRVVDEDLRTVDRKLNFAKLRLLTEWGQVGMLETLLHELGQEADDMVSADVLGRLLQLGLLDNQPDIATLAFARGASVEVYEDPVFYEKEASGTASDKDYSWVELLEGASDEQEERYMLTLIKEAQETIKYGRNKARDKQDSMKDVMKTVEEIKSNAEAIKILNEICTTVVMKSIDEVGVLGQLSFNFTIEPLAGGEGKSHWAGANFNLFLFLILVNRAELAHMFFAREAQRDAASALANALWACLLCRKLSQLPEVGQFAYHLKNGFETTAAKYEGIAEGILKLAYEKSDRFTCQALEQPLKQCPQWTLLDLIAQGNCKGVISACPEVCIAAVQSRFYGDGSLVTILERMNANARKVFTIWEDNFKSQEAEAKGHSTKTEHNEEEGDKHKPQSWGKLLVCLAVDAVGASYYIYPLLPWFYYTFIWAPVMTFMVNYLHKNISLSLFALIEGLLLDLFPSATIGYLLENEKIKEGGKAERQEGGCNFNEVGMPAIKQGFFPIDHFILDVLTYCVLAHLLTLVVIMTPSFSTFCIELIVLALMLIDAIPDIVFEGLNYEHRPSASDGAHDNSAMTYTEVIAKGFKKYIQNSG